MKRLKRWQAAAMALVIGLAMPCIFAAGNPSDSGIAAAIKQRLLADPSVRFAKLNVKVASGTASLSGTVFNLLAKERADRITQSVRGVRIVLNDIVVKPLPRPDEDLRRDIEAALRADPATDAFEIKTKVSSGAVTLSGVVESPQERQLTIRAAKGVRGVSAVIDKITVEIETNRPDADVATDIRRALETDVWLDARQVDVDVQEGKVRLSGGIGSAAGKTRAVVQAWVPGARSVDGSALKVEPNLADGMRGQPRPNPSSEQLKQMLKDAFRRDPRIASFNIGIDVHGSLVKLAGIVDNLKARHAAIRLAENMRGISEVRSDELRLHPPTPLPNRDVAGEVQAAFARDPYLTDDPLKVTTGAGIVYLQGEVDSQYEKSHAEDLVAGIKGVVTIANSLDAKATGERSFEEMSDVAMDTFYRQLKPDTVPTAESAPTDDELRRNVEQEIRWSPFVDAEKIKVHVERGVVTLTGVTDSEHGYRAASANAREGGATHVRNLIKIE